MGLNKEYPSQEKVQSYDIGGCEVEPRPCYLEEIQKRAAHLRDRLVDIDGMLRDRNDRAMGETEKLSRPTINEPESEYGGALAGISGILSACHQTCEQIEQEVHRLGRMTG